MSQIDTIGLGTARRGLERKIGWSRFAIFVERVWPRLWLPLAVALIFLITSLAGVWPLLPANAHMIALGLFGAAFVAAFFPAVRTAWPNREDGVRRLERGSGIAHRPISSYEDKLANDAAADPVAGGLWNAHLQRLARLFERMQAKPPVPRVERHDPYALRTVLLLGAACLAFVAGDAWPDRIASAFRLAPIVAGPDARLDAWVTPPAYTGRPPILIADGSKPLAPDNQAARVIEVPEGSILTVRSSGRGHERFSVQDVDPAGVAKAIAAEKPKDAGKAEAAATHDDIRVEIASSRTIKIFDGPNERLSWSFNVLDDLPPTISLEEPPKPTNRGELKLAYQAKDDYRVGKIEAFVARPDAKPAHALTGMDGKPIPPLYDVPKLPLKIDQGKDPKSVHGKTYVDLASHPWAGLPVTLTLEALDQAGNVGKSTPKEILLPSRRFTEPLARALVEQRRVLALEPARFQDVADALDALTIAPDQFPTSASAYLGIRSVYWRLNYDVTETGLRSAVDQLWSIALKLEEGDLTDAQRRLRQIQDRLSKAIEDGASDEEIQKLMSELRQAMNDYLKQLAQQGQKNPGQNGNQPQQKMSQKDLEQMLKQLEDLAKSGSKDAAQQMLSDLRDLLDRLQSQQAQNGQNGQNGEMGKMLDKFGRMITRQRKLLDDTFGQQQQGMNGQGGEGQGDGQQGESGQRGKGKIGEGSGSGDGSDDPGSLAERQGRLKNDLGRLLDDLKGMMAQGGEGLDDAQKAMEEAKRALEQQNLDGATDQQSRALDQLRKGAQSMTEQMLNGQAGRQGSNGEEDRDPLGRPTRSNDPGHGPNRAMVPREIDTQRAREILDELRRRLGDGQRPKSELDYIERLLKKAQ